MASVDETAVQRDLWPDAARRWRSRAEAAEAMVIRLTDAAEGYRGLYEAAEAKVGAVEALVDEIRTAPAETWGVDLAVPTNRESAYMAGADAAITFATNRLRAALAVEPTR